MYSKVTVKVPDLTSSFSCCGGYDYSKASTKADNTKMVKTIYSKYGSIISTWARVFDIPVGVIVGFIATESGGVNSAPNRYKATGLMQVTPNAIFDCATKWTAEVKSPLPSEARNLLTQKIPTFFTVSKVSSIESKILNLLQNDSNFNVMSGTLILRWLLERFSDESGTSKSLNKAMVAYNAGAYLTTLGSTKITRETPMDTLSLVTSRIPAESKSYLYKMLGKDGFLQIIYKEKAI